jgi:hypothetical protein
MQKEKLKETEENWQNKLLHRRGLEFERESKRRAGNGVLILKCPSQAAIGQSPPDLGEAEGCSIHHQAPNRYLPLILQANEVRSRLHRTFQID